jgi:hypothetical protein
MHTALATFRKCGFNPFILLEILRVSVNLPAAFDDGENGSNISESFDLQKMLGMVGALKR